MHVKDEKVFTKVEKLLPYIQKSSKLYTEIDLSAINSYSNDIFKMPANMGLSDLISEKEFSKTTKIFDKAFGVELSNFEYYFPIITVNRLAESILSQDRRVPLDSYLWMKAKEFNIELDGLETIQDQIHVLNSIPLKFQLKQLKEIRRNINKFRKMTFKLLNYYQKEDIAKLYHQAKSSLGKYRNLMIYDRNRSMVDSINANNLKQCFYVVGAAHLSGQFGILALLKQAKWKTKRILI